MYKKFGKTKDWQRILIPSIVLFGFFCIPVSVFLLYVAIESWKIEPLLIAIIVSLFTFMLSLKHVRNIYEFPLIEIDDNFIVLNRPLQNRSVCTLSKITNVKPFLKSVFLIHNGFPILINMNSLSKEERLSIIKIITSDNYSGES